MRLSRLASVVAGLGAAALLLAGCGGSSTGGGGGASASPADQILRVAMTEPGTDLVPVWNQVKAQFESAHPGWTVQYNFQNDDIYSTVGLPSLLSGGNAPDIYFEWSGNRLETRYADGYAASIGDQLKAKGVTDKYVDGAFGGTTVDGKTVMLPLGKDVSNVIWYNKDIFTKLGLTPPTTWAEFDALNAKLKAAGITPYAMGNKDLWPAGNWNAHILSRIVGEQAYADALNMKSPLDSPEWVAAMDKMKQIHDSSWINDSVNSISDNEGYTLFFTGKAAMTPIGSWLVDVRNGQSPNFNMDWFNLPAIDGGKGNQQSVMGVSTGLVVNAKSAKIDQAVDFMAVLSGDDIQKAFVKAGSSSLNKAAAATGLNPLSARLLQLIETAPEIVSPPDTGYNLKVADALNTATSAVLGGAMSSQDALTQAQQKIDALK
jgi:ABC-type glycerol-3-phosphate transport system substrate-binding protein